MPTTNGQSLLTKMINYRASLKQELKVKEQEADKLSKRIAECEKEIVEQMSLDQVKSIKQGEELVYLQTVRNVTKKAGVTPEEVMAVLKGSELDYLLKLGYNAQSLKGAVIEAEKNERELPEGLKELINIGSYTKVATRKA